MAFHTKIGKIGEDVAAHFLLSKGFLIVERNRYFGKKEIDIIAEKDNIVRLVEVKTMQEGKNIQPEDNMTKEKLSHLHHVLNLLERSEEFEGKRLQVDFLSVLLDLEKRRASCKLIQNIELIRYGV